MNDANTIPANPGEADEAARLAEAARRAEADAKAEADDLTAWRASVSARCEELAAARRARNAAHARHAAAARWKDGKGPPSRPCRLYADDLEVLRRFVPPFSGQRATPAVAVRRLLTASRGLLWTVDEEGRVVVVGPLRDLLLRG